MRSKEMKGINLISIFSGMIFALLTCGIVKCFGIDETLKLSVFAGALFTVILYLALLLYKHNINRKYLNLEKMIPRLFFTKQTEISVLEQKSEMEIFIFVMMKLYVFLWTKSRIQWKA